MRYRTIAYHGRIVGGKQLSRNFKLPHYPILDIAMK